MTKVLIVLERESDNGKWRSAKRTSNLDKGCCDNSSLRP